MRIFLLFGVMLGSGVFGFGATVLWRASLEPDRFLLVAICTLLGVLIVLCSLLGIMFASHSERQKKLLEKLDTHG